MTQLNFTSVILKRSWFHNLRCWLWLTIRKKINFFFFNYGRIGHNCQSTITNGIPQFFFLVPAPLLKQYIDLTIICYLNYIANWKTLIFPNNLVFLGSLTVFFNTVLVGIKKRLECKNQCTLSIQKVNQSKK